LRKYFLATLLCGLLWFLYGQDATAATLARRTFDLFDPRPPRSVLIVGNSRTYYNDMPAMVRDIADSAQSPTKFQIQTAAYPGAYFKDHWSNRRTRRLLDEHWDDVVFQGASGEQWREEELASFLDFGGRLAREARSGSRSAHLIVNWAYEPQLYEKSGWNRSAHLAKIRAGHRRLSQEAGLWRVNVAGAWEMVRRDHPHIRLTSDGNHPTLAGSYLYALAVYAHLSAGPVQQVTFVPDGLAPDDAQAIRDAVDSVGSLDGRR
jgi:hypothetical protein